MAEPRALLSSLARLFNESVMGFLALVALATALGPLVFDVSPGIDRVLTVIEWSLVGAFAAEFIISGALAPDFRAWIRSPWRIVDAITILGPVAALLPQVSDAASGSLVLRLLRVGRAVALGTRAGTVAVGMVHRQVRERHGIPAFSIIAESDPHPVDFDWSRFAASAHEPGPAFWAHGTNFDRVRFRDLARAAGLTEQDLERLLAEDGHGKVRQGARCAALVLRMPTVPDEGFPEVRWNRLLAVVAERGLLTAVDGSLDVQNGVSLQDAPLSAMSFRARIVSALFSLARDRHRAISQRFDEEVRHLEAMEEGKDFLRATFRLRREISAAALDLRRLKGVVRALADGKTTLRAVDLKGQAFVEDMAQDMESLYATVDQLCEDLKSLIALHINLKSFEMNRFLKLLAVVTFLGLIPSVVGGLLGMNILGQPWPVTLGQIVFGVAMMMATALYVFAVKGWLK